MSVPTNESAATACPVCGTAYRFGETGADRSPEQASAGSQPMDEAVAYCPNPDCPSHAEDRVDDPGGA
jgi:hypothetical protein